MGYHIFHDIPADGFNLDHVAIGPAGVLCIETKTYGKPISGQTIISFEQGQVLVNGYALTRNPIEQVKWNAKWLMDMMEEMTSRRFFTTRRRISRVVRGFYATGLRRLGAK